MAESRMHKVVVNVPEEYRPGDFMHLLFANRHKRGCAVTAIVPTGADGTERNMAVHVPMALDDDIDGLYLHDVQRSQYPGRMTLALRRGVGRVQQEMMASYLKTLPAKPEARNVEPPTPVPAAACAVSETTAPAADPKPQQQLDQQQQQLDQQQQQLDQQQKQQALHDLQRDALRAHQIRQTLPPGPTDDNAAEVAAAVVNHFTSIPQGQRTTAEQNALAIRRDSATISRWLDLHVKIYHRQEHTVKTALWWALHPTKPVSWARSLTSALSADATTIQTIAIHVRMHPFTKTDICNTMHSLHDVPMHRRRTSGDIADYKNGWFRSRLIRKATRRATRCCCAVITP